MPGKDHWNAGVLLRHGRGASPQAARAARRHPTDTITEDLHTSVVLHSEGWKSVYLNETLVTGLAPVI
jgi:cellulose synthase (UDP-forming)